MRVLHVTPDFPPNIIGGIGIHVEYVHRALVELGIDSHVLTSWAAKLGDPRVHMAPMFGPDHECGPKPLANTLFELQKSAGVAIADLCGFIPDIVHAHDYRAIVGAEALAHSFGAKLIVTKHSMHPFIKNPDPNDPRRTLFYEYVHELQREGFARADRVIILSEEMRGSIEPYRSELANFKKLHIIPNGVEMSSGVVPTASRDDGNLLFVGRLEHSKGVDVLIDAIGLLDKSSASDVRLTVVGRGAHEEYLKSKAASLTNGASVEFTGFLPQAEVMQMLRSAKLCIVPSRHDVYPITVLEAMASGTPIIASRVGGLVSQLGDGLRGVLVEPDDAETLAEALRYAITNYGEIEKMAHGAREWVSECRSWRQTAARTADVYRGIVESPGGTVS